MGDGFFYLLKLATIIAYLCRNRMETKRKKKYKLEFFFSKQ